MITPPPSTPTPACAILGCHRGRGAREGLRRQPRSGRSATSPAARCDGTRAGFGQRMATDHRMQGSAAAPPSLPRRARCNVPDGRGFSRRLLVQVHDELALAHLQVKWPHLRTWCEGHEHVVEPKAPLWPTFCRRNAGQAHQRSCGHFVIGRRCGRETHDPAACSHNICIISNVVPVEAQRK